MRVKDTAFAKGRFTKKGGPSQPAEAVRLLSDYFPGMDSQNQCAPFWFTAVFS